MIAFFAGYIPLQKRRAVIAGEAHEEQQALPRVEVIKVGRSTRQSELELPGNIQPITEAPILARADGYIERRMVDIGDRVKAGQMLAEIDAPELTDQVTQAKATVQQAQAALEQATPTCSRARPTWNWRASRPSAPANWSPKARYRKQDDDQYQAQYQSKLAALQSLEKAIDVQRTNIAAAQANVARLEKMQSYRMVQAPFDGVITLRNVDVGALVNAGSTLLFRIAQTATLRTYVNVPQTYADSIRPGRPAILTVSNLPGRHSPARWRAPRTRSIPAAARCWWKSRCRMRTTPAAGHVRAGGSAQCPRGPAAAGPERSADRARRRRAGRRGSPGSHGASSEDRSRPRLRRPHGSAQRAAAKETRSSPIPATCAKASR